MVHRHILVDGNIVDRPSYRVKPGQTIQVKAKSQTMVPFQAAAEGVHRDVLPAVPGYLDVNLPSLKATLTRKPEAEEIPVQVNIQYVVEFYARRSGSPYCKNIQFKDIQRKPRSRYGCEASRFFYGVSGGMSFGSFHRYHGNHVASSSSGPSRTDVLQPI